MKYGHLDDKPDDFRTFAQDKMMPKDLLHPYLEKEVKNGIKSFQNSFGLKTTGYLDEVARRIMKSPRCGVRDKGESDNESSIKITLRKPRYVKQGSRWKKTALKWTIYRYLQSSTLSRDDQKKILDKAFKKWEYASALKFTYTLNKNQADIIIQFLRGKSFCFYNFNTVYFTNPNLDIVLSQYFCLLWANLR